jgi:hypothetical protein
MTILYFTEIDGSGEYIVFFEEDPVDLEKGTVTDYCRNGFKLEGKPIQADVFQGHVLPMERALWSE